MVSFRHMSPLLLICATAAFVVATGNLTFFSRLTDSYAFEAGNLAFIASTGLLQLLLLIVLLMPFSHRKMVRPTLSIVLLITAASAYFQDTYGVVIDRVMIHSFFATNKREAFDLINIGFITRFTLLGIVPGLVIWYLPLRWSDSFRASFVRNLLATSVSLVGIVVLFFAFSANYSSFFREHKMVRYYSNPIGPVYALASVLSNDVKGSVELKAIGTDAKIVRVDGRLPKLVVLVVGEAVRYQNLGINGYGRDTTPKLATLDLVNFRHFIACGTATAVSVPCFFSALGREHFSIDSASRQENLLDVLVRAGVHVLWRDNNSDSKGVAARVNYESYMSADRNTVCDMECRDEGMLVGLQSQVNKVGSGDILIVLHQMGNHGPAYYKRYPAAFEVFKPTCKSNELSLCPDAEIVNAYDNALLYTDDFLFRVVQFLQQNSANRETAMLYASDHGESLGEYGIYLHGLPLSIAPDEQVHVPALMWFGEHFPVDRRRIEHRAVLPASHNNIFHTILDLFGVESSVFDPASSLLR